MIKKLKKILIYSLILIFLTVIIDMLRIAPAYINKSSITFNVTNVRNPQIKKIVRKLDIIYGKFLLILSKKQRSHYLNDDIIYKSLPDEIIVEPIKNGFSYTNGKNINTSNEWFRSHGNHSSNRFSDIKQINKFNVKKLELFWKYQFEKVGRDVQSNPIFVDGKIYTPTPYGHTIAIDINNGKKVWEYPLGARRGIIYQDDNLPKLFFCDNKKLVSLNANTGETISTFGKNGITKLKSRCHITPVIIDDNIIVATFEPAVEVFDIKTGKLLWKYYLKYNETKQSRHGGKRYDFSGGNPWGGISADLDRKIVFITTGNAGSYFVGVNRPGKNKYSNSIIAIDIKNKKKIWDFQEVEHDIWNLDIPAPPILTSIKKNNKKIDVVVAVTKLGNTIILDRLSGKPIFGFKKSKAPLSTVPGEKVAYYQPKIKLPEPFAKQFFSKKDITNISKESYDYISNKIKNMNYGFFVPNSLTKKNVAFNIRGGAEWMGASINNHNGIMYVTANNTPTITSIKKKKSYKYEYYEYQSFLKTLVDQDGYPGSIPPWGTLTALNLNTGKIIWQIPFGEFEELTKKGLPITGTPNMGGATATAGGLIFATGTMDKKIRAFDIDNGNELWDYKLPFVGSGPPSTFMFNNEQYVVVISTGSSTLYRSYPNQVEFGDWIYCFKVIK